MSKTRRFEFRTRREETRGGGEGEDEESFGSVSRDADVPNGAAGAHSAITSSPRSPSAASIARSWRSSATKATTPASSRRSPSSGGEPAVAVDGDGADGGDGVERHRVYRRVWEDEGDAVALRDPALAKKRGKRG